MPEAHGHALIIAGVHSCAERVKSRLAALAWVQHARSHLFASMQGACFSRAAVVVPGLQLLHAFLGSHLVALQALLLLIADTVAASRFAGGGLGGVAAPALGALGLAPNVLAVFPARGGGEGCGVKAVAMQAQGLGAALQAKSLPICDWTDAKTAQRLGLRCEHGSASGHAGAEHGSRWWTAGH